MQFTNYHSHSHYCDGKGLLADYAVAAAKKGMYAYGFSGHSPVPFDSEWNMPQESLEDYLEKARELQVTYKDKLKIFVGLEVDFIDGLVSVENFKKYKLDYTIGGIHYLKKFEDGQYWNFDSHADAFNQGLQKIFSGDIKKAVKAYYHELIKMVEHASPNVIAHMDLIKKFNQNNIFFSENDKWYHSLVEETLEIIKQSDCIVEINTRGVYKKLDKEYYPSNWIIKRCQEKNIPLTMNADAHHPSQVDALLADVAGLLLNTGVEEVYILDERGWYPVGFNQQGIVI